MISSLRLSKELIDQIVFGMENQDRKYFLDTDEAEVIQGDQRERNAPKGRYLDLPEWRSVDGYNLMERFVASLHNPIFRERLRAILASGRGVFRQYKDALRERPEIERRWFVFKERAMRDLVTDWFNDLRERQGLERLEVEGLDTDTANLIATDFVFTWADAGMIDQIPEVDRGGFHEAHPDLPGDLVDVYYARSRDGLPEPDEPGSVVLVGQTQGGDWVAFLWAVVATAGQTAGARVVNIYVQPEFRGLGLARELFFEYCRRAHDQGICDVTVDLPGNAMDLEQKMQEYGLSRSGVQLRLDLNRWHRAEL